MEKKNLQKLVIVYHSGNIYEGTKRILRALYSSAEKLYCDIIEEGEKAHKACKHVFKVGGYEFNTSDFISYHLTTGELQNTWHSVYTIQEWFDEDLEVQEDL